MPRRTRIQSNDPYTLGELLRTDIPDYFNGGLNATFGKLPVSATINPAIRNLVLIVAGQSNYTTVGNVQYIPVSSTVSQLHNFNIYDGGMYQAIEPLLGCSDLNGSLSVPSISCIGTHIGDTLIQNNKFDRVIIVPMAIGGASVFNYLDTTPDTGLANRLPVTMKRLASVGIKPNMTGVTFAVIWGQGESDHGVSTADYEAAMHTIISSIDIGVTGRWFINEQTWLSGVIDTNVETAQINLPNGTNIWAGADADSIGATFREPTNTHFLSTGLAQLNTLLFAAMHASGAPY